MNLNVSRSVLTAGLILLALLAYFGVRSLGRGGDNGSTAPVESAQSGEPAKPSVVVRSVSAEPHTIYTTLKGRTQPDRMVAVRSETMGTVVRADLAEGSPVKRGDILCALGVESRAARLAEAEAAVDARTVDYVAAQDLAEKGWASPNQAKSAKAALDAAEAGLNAAKVEIGKTRLRAPFDGVFETREAEAGDFLSPGSPCGMVVDLDPMVVSLDATEAQASALERGAPARISLADGRTREGTVRYIARTANDQTRTFRVEVEAPNPDNAVAAGLTASVQIAAGEAPAVLLSPALLVLHDDGRVGARYVDMSDTIQFADLTIVDDAEDGVWVTGLPDDARILASGQGYVREGIEVVATSAGGL